jgi:hypothetical protein
MPLTFQADVAMGLSSWYSFSVPKTRTHKEVGPGSYVP